MPSKRRKFNRPLGEERYRKIFILVSEGSKTEPQYFAVFNNQNSHIHVKCLKNKNDSSPNRVLARMKRYLKEYSLRESDEAWLVVDKDQWADAQLSQLYEWSLKSDNYGFALSNPKFEFWLLLHFEDGKRVGSSKECSHRLGRHLPDYSKSIDIEKISDEMIAHAISRARERDKPPCVGWPDTTGTTVYKLVENILKSREN